MSIQNLIQKDLWEENTGSSLKGIQNTIHIRIQQRNGRKRITTIQGIDPKQDTKAILAALKGELHCNGNVEKDKEFGDVIKLTGDQRYAVRDFLVREFIETKENIKVHGE